VKERRYILYCDEAYNAQPALRYHHYYGGLLIGEGFVSRLEQQLLNLASLAGLAGEIKWGKVDGKSRGAYEAFMSGFFDELAQGYFKVRVLFLDRYLKPEYSVKKSKQEQFFTLYYLFVTRAFGWKEAPFATDESVSLRFLFDQLPHKREAREKFREFLSNIPRTKRFGHLKLLIPKDGIAEVDSRRHRIAQGIDVLIGALGYRMNRLHRILTPSGRRGKRTIAKDGVSNAIRTRLRDFGVKNIGITTGTYGKPLALWNDPIRLWRLEPKDFTVDNSWCKKSAP
jgi:hypothetical protein